MHRRQVLKAIPALWLTAPAISEASPTEPTLDERVAQLAEALQKAHGGNWAIKQDQQSRYILLSRH